MSAKFNLTDLGPLGLLKTGANTAVVMVAVAIALSRPEEFGTIPGFIGLALGTLFVCACVEYIFIGRHREINESIAKSKADIEQTKAEIAAMQAAGVTAQALRDETAAARGDTEAAHRQWAAESSKAVQCRNRLEQQGIHLDNDWNIVKDEHRAPPEA